MGPFIVKLCKALEENRIPYALVGGYAVALHGAVRGTVDIDLVIEWQLDTLKKMENILNTLGLKSSIPVNAEDVFQHKDEYVGKRNLIAWNFINPTNPTESVDIIITFDLTGKKRIARTISMVDISILDIDELIAMKRLAAREQDLNDILALERLKNENSTSI